MNKENPSVLVAIPYHREKEYCKDILLEALNDLTYPHKEIIMRFDPKEFASDNAVKDQREFFRSVALEMGVDYLFFMGCDTIPPYDVLERLLKHKKDIVGGVYWARPKENGSVAGAVAWIDGLKSNEIFKSKLSGSIEDFSKLLKVDGMGMDCVLISREVLEKISFLEWGQNDDDYPFYDRAKELGYEIFVDTNIQCRHFSTKEIYSFNGKAYIDDKEIKNGS